MRTPSSRVEVFIERGLFALSALLFLWLLLQAYVPAHPSGQSASPLLLAAAMVCMTGASLVRSPTVRRGLMGASALLLLASLWWS